MRQPDRRPKVSQARHQNSPETGDDGHLESSHDASPTECCRETAGYRASPLTRGCLSSGQAPWLPLSNEQCSRFTFGSVGLTFRMSRAPRRHDRTDVRRVGSIRVLACVARYSELWLCRHVVKSRAPCRNATTTTRPSSTRYISRYRNTKISRIFGSFNSGTMRPRADSVARLAAEASAGSRTYPQLGSLLRCRCNSVSASRADAARLPRGAEQPFAAQVCSDFFVRNDPPGLGVGKTLTDRLHDVEVVQRRPGLQSSSKRSRSARTVSLAPLSRHHSEDLTNLSPSSFREY